VVNLLDRLAEVQPEKLREKLASSREIILANRQMVALDEDLPLPVAPEQLFCTPRYPELIEALKACEFKSLLREVEAEAANGRTPGVQQADLFA
jgi:DNA polymerase-1